MSRLIHLVINIEDVGPESHVATDYQSAAEWLLGELRANPDAPYPPVADEAARWPTWSRP